MPDTEPQISEQQAEGLLAEAVKTPEPAASDTEAPATDWKAEAEKWKAMSRKHEAQATSNADKARQFDALEEANKTELQKAQEALEAANRRATDAEAARLRSDIARTKGVPVELLTATDEDTLAAQADALLAFRGNQPAPAAPASSGVTAPSGAAPIRSFTDAQIAAMSPEEYAANKADIYRARDAGLITL